MFIPVTNITRFDAICVEGTVLGVFEKIEGDLTDDMLVALTTSSSGVEDELFEKEEVLESAPQATELDDLLHRIATGDNVPVDIRPQLRELLYAYRDIFIEKGQPLPTTTLLEATIPLKPGTSPIYTRQFPISFNMREPLRAEIDNMLASGIIERSGLTSWNNPLLILKKKTPPDQPQRYRIVSDLRGLNEVVVKKQWPLPTVQESLDVLHSSTYFSTLDLHSAYFQIGLAPESRDCVSFSTPQGNFRYTRLPQGLSVSSFIFSQAMSMALNAANLHGEVLSYMEDLLLHTQTDAQAHLATIRRTFQALRDCNFKIDVRKTSLFQEKLDFLGFEITKQGYTPNKAKIRLIQDIPTPSNVGKLKSFLSTTNFYRRCIPGYATLAASLHNLTKPSVRFKWLEEHEIQFNKIKQALLEATVLAFPDLSDTAEPFECWVDASAHCLGASLAQSQAGVLQPIAFSSRKLSDVEEKLSTFRRELLALLSGLQSFRNYIAGRRVIVYSDHRALLYLFSTKRLPVVLHRIMLGISEYDLEIRFVPGTQQVADLFSRLWIKDGKLDFVPDSTSDGQAPLVTFDQFVQFYENFVRQAASTSAVSGKSSGFPLDSLSPDEQYEVFLTALAEANQVAFPIQTPEGAPSQVVRRDLWKIIPSLDKDKLLLEQCSDPLLTKARLQAGTEGAGGYLLDSGGILYRTDKVGIPRICIPTSMREEIFTFFHSSPLSHHLGTFQTYQIMKRNVSFPNMERFIRERISSCDVCLRSKHNHHPFHLPLADTVVPSFPKETYFLDLIGPLYQCHTSHPYALVVVDYYSRFVMIRALTDCKSDTILAELFYLFALYGSCLSMRLDNASYFKSDTFQSTMRLFNIDLKFGSSYRPESQSIVERSNYTIKIILTTFLLNSSGDWVHCLPFVISTINSRSVFGSDLTAYDLFFSHPTMTAQEVQFKYRTKYFDSDQDTLVRLALYDTTYSKLSTMIEGYHAKIKDSYDTEFNTEDVSIPEGSKVYLKSEAPLKKNESKFTRGNYLGPFVVIAETRYTVTIKHLHTEKTYTVHKSKIKSPMHLRATPGRPDGGDGTAQTEPFHVRAQAQSSTVEGCSDPPSALPTGAQQESSRPTTRSMTLAQKSRQPAVVCAVATPPLASTAHCDSGALDGPRAAVVTLTAQFRALQEPETKKASLSAFQEQVTRLLTALDAVDTTGHSDLRRVRKALVDEVLELSAIADSQVLSGNTVT